MPKGNTGFEKPKIQKINEKTFPLIKQLIEAGVKSVQIQKMLDISSSTFCYVKQSNSLQEYREKVNEIAQRSLERRAKAAVEKETVKDAEAADAKPNDYVEAKPATVDFTEVGLEIMHKDLEEIKALLKTLTEHFTGTDAVTTVVSDVENEPKRRSIFGFGSKTF